MPYLFGEIMQVKEIEKYQIIYGKEFSPPLILVVSSNRFFRWLLIQLMGFINPEYEFIEVQDIDKASPLIPNQALRMVLMDLDVMDMDALKRLQSIKNWNPLLQLIVFSNEVSPENRKAVIHAGVEALVSKSRLIMDFRYSIAPMHRFDFQPVWVNGEILWNFLLLF